MKNLFQSNIKWIAIGAALIILSATGVAIASQQINKAKPEISTVELLTPSPDLSPTSTPTPSPISSPMQEQSTKKSSTAPTSDNQTPKTDSAMRIEICRTAAKNEKERYKNIGYQEYAKTNPGIAELANASNNEQTEQVALKYGYIKESDIIRSADIYKKLIDEGKPSDYAKSVAESMANSWWTYLRSLHDWAVKNINDFETGLESKANAYESEYYMKCLNYQE